jgi:hypothetical protein
MTYSEVRGFSVREARISLKNRKKTTIIGNLVVTHVHSSFSGFWILKIHKSRLSYTETAQSKAKIEFTTLEKVRVSADLGHRLPWDEEEEYDEQKYIRKQSKVRMDLSQVIPYFLGMILFSWKSVFDTFKSERDLPQIVIWTLSLLWRRCVIIWLTWLRVVYRQDC